MAIDLRQFLIPPSQPVDLRRFLPSATTPMTRAERLRREAARRQYATPGVTAPTPRMIPGTGISPEAVAAVFTRPYTSPHTGTQYRSLATYGLLEGIPRAGGEAYFSGGAGVLSGPGAAGARALESATSRAAMGARSALAARRGGAVLSPQATAAAEREAVAALSGRAPGRIPAAVTGGAVEAQVPGQGLDSTRVAMLRASVGSSSLRLPAKVATQRGITDLAAGRTPSTPALRNLRAVLGDDGFGELVSTLPVQRKVTVALGLATPIRAETEALYSAERSRRLGQALAVGAKTPGQAGFFRQLGALKGELPKPKYELPFQIGQDDLNTLFDQVRRSPLVPGYQQIQAQAALQKLLGGRIGKVATGAVPTESELRLLGRVFGEDFVRIASRNPLGIKGVLQEAASVPRAIMSSVDLSAPFRQGLVAGARYPKEFFRAFPDMFRAAGSEEAYQAILQDITKRPTFRLMQQSNLALTGLDEAAEVAVRAAGGVAREEVFVSSLPERIPILGRLFRGSNRAYTGFLNKLRADTFDRLLSDAAKAGVPQTDDFLSSAARFINSATGRGDLGSWERAAGNLATIMFSPRLLASRLNVLNPVFYAQLDPFVRKQALGAAVSLVGAGMTIMGLAKAAGAGVGTNPLSADFGKVKIGNTRISLFGGFEQYPRIIAQLYAGKLISSTTGKEYTLGEGYRPLTRWDIALRFFENKANPVAGFIINLLRQQTAIGEPVSIPHEVADRFVPMILEDLWDLYEDGGLPRLPIGMLGIFGMGIQTYGPQRKPSLTDVALEQFGVRRPRR